MKFNDETLNLLRELYARAVFEEEANTELSKTLDSIKSAHHLVLSYKGSNTALKAKYVINPYVKWNVLKEAGIYFEKAIKKNPECLEARFLRYAVESNIPAFLNMSKNVEEDKAVIINKFSEFYALNPGLAKAYANYLLGSIYFVKKEKEIITKVIN
jgi:hypothetical protein